MKRAMWKRGTAVCLLVLMAAGGIPAEARAETSLTGEASLVTGQTGEASLAAGRAGEASLAAGRAGETDLAGTAGSVFVKLAAVAQSGIKEAGETLKDLIACQETAQSGETDADAQKELSEEEKREEEKIDAYFRNAVFVGDSIMLGFRNYALKRQDTFLCSLDFLAAGSFSASNALWPVDEKSVHPVYQGQQRQIWESIAMMQGKRVFLMLGMNDLNVYGLEGSRDHFQELIGHILEKNPEAEIHIMSMTYVLKGKEAAMLQNDTIRQYNEMLRQMAEENGWGYVDMAEALSDGNGNLAAQYCSDGFVHQNPEAYDVWVTVLRDYAANRPEQQGTG